MSHVGQKIDDAEWAQIQAQAAQSRRNGSAPRKVHVFSYRRCSHRDSRESGLGLEAQGERMEAYIKLLKTKTDVSVGHMFSDEAVNPAVVTLVRLRFNDRSCVSPASSLNPASVT